MGKCGGCKFMIQAESSCVCAHPKGEEQYVYWIFDCKVYGELSDGFEERGDKTFSEVAKEIGWEEHKSITQMATGEMHELNYYKKPNDTLPH